jgi:hypothetical protein
MAMKSEQDRRVTGQRQHRSGDEGGERFEPGHPPEEGASFGAGPPPRYFDTGFMGRGGPGSAGGSPPGPKGYQRSDERLREDISERIMQAHTIDSSDVTVEVSGAKVVLEGTVPDRRMKHAIEDLADACPGIQDIENRIRVRR